MSSLLGCLVGPRLYRKFRADSRQAVEYVPSSIESTCEGLLKCLKLSWRVCAVTSPLIGLILWRRGYFNSADDMQPLGKFGATLAAVAMMLWLCQGFARASNPAYVAFLQDLVDVRAGRKSRALLRQYDFDFTAWPCDYSARVAATTHSQPGRQTEESRVHVGATGADTSRGGCSWDSNSFSAGMLKIAAVVGSYLISRSFGRWLMYPGSTGLLNTLIVPVLHGARKLQIEGGGLRAKVETYLGNHIDTMFFDKRKKVGSRNSSDLNGSGNTLVICCEGNAAFYENGCMVTPLAANYSVLGWNHPGFGCSTMSGKAYPVQEQDAIDAVMQYAINELGFAVTDIVLFCWSIGGYSLSWAASRYPDVRAVILDASFDSILPLAQERMPRSWRNFVEFTIKRHLDLNNAELVCSYPGPVLIIRRTRDELISTVPGDLRTNRGNDLLRCLLRHRYPGLLVSCREADDALLEWLSTTDQGHSDLLLKHGVTEDRCTQLLRENTNDSLAGLPTHDKVCLVLYLASVYMKDFESEHCVPLPSDYFVIPSNIQLDVHER